MKNILVIFVPVCLLLIGCSKDINSEPEIKKEISVSFEKQPELNFFITNNTAEILYFDLNKTYFEFYDDMKWRRTSDDLGYTNLGFSFEISPFSTTPIVSTEESTSLISDRKYRIVYTFFRDKKLEGASETVSCEFEI